MIAPTTPPVNSSPHVAPPLSESLLRLDAYLRPFLATAAATPVIEPYIPTAEDWREYEAYLDALHGDDHDGQVDPNDLAYWSMPDADWRAGIEGPDRACA